MKIAQIVSNNSGNGSTDRYESRALARVALANAAAAHVICPL